MSAVSITYGNDPSDATFSVVRYQRMIELGILTSEDRVELLENHLVMKTPANPRHDGTIDFITDTLRPRPPSG